MPASLPEQAKASLAAVLGLAVVMYLSAAAEPYRRLWAPVMTPVVRSTPAVYPTHQVRAHLRGNVPGAQALRTALQGVPPVTGHVPINSSTSVSFGVASGAVLAVVCICLVSWWRRGERHHLLAKQGASTVMLTVLADKEDASPPAVVAAEAAADAHSREKAMEAAFLAELAVTGQRAGLGRDVWQRLQSPVRYLGNELGAVHKPWDSAEVRMVVSYPEVYEVGISNLGHLVLYSMVNRQDGLLCDRCYLPLPDLSDWLEKNSKPLFAVESQRPLGDFHAVGMSLAYELGGCNCLQMMHLAQLPKTWRERLEMDGDGPFDPSRGSPPLVFAGGPTATSNPEPFADFFDFFALGDGEECVPEIGHCLRRCQKEGLNRVETLYRLATEVAGIYVPMFYDCTPGFGGAVFPIREGVPPRVLRRVATPDPTASFALQPYLETVHDRLTVEIRRGCTRGCRFCQPGMLTRPARDVAPEKVVQAVEEGVRRTGYREFSLLSLSCSDYLSLPAVGLEIKNRLKDQNVTLSLPSQRVDRFDENIANIVGGVKKGSLTFAPEAGTQRMRDIINKGLSNEELLRGVKTAFEKGWGQVKLYFMIGLPGETDADVLGIADTVEWLQKECTQRHRRLKFHLTVSNFTPKPHTPFQWHTVSTAEFVRKQELLRSAFKRFPWGSVKVNYTSTRISAMEDFIGRGDRRLCQVMLKAWEHGAHKDVWWEGTNEAFKSWDKAIEESGLTWKYRLVEDGEWDVLDHLGDARYRGQGGGGRGRLDRGALQEARLNRPLPWDHINTGISKAWLKADLQRALEAITVSDCSYHACSECGVCGEDFGENVAIPPPPLPEYQGGHEPDSRKGQKLRITFAKLGSMACVGHLDTMRLLDRAFRRAALPLSVFDSDYNSRPRISCAVALPLGWTSEAEVFEVILTEPLPHAEVRDRLTAALPAGMPVLAVEEFPIYHETGVLRESIGSVMETQEMLVQVGPAPPEGDAPEESAEGRTALPQIDYPQLVAATLALPTLEVPKKTKKNPTRQLDLRAQLLGLECVPEEELLPRYGFSLPLEPGTAVLRVRGTATQTGKPPGILNASHLLQLLAAAGGGPTFRQLHAHRVAVHWRPLSELPEAELAAHRALVKRQDWRNLQPTVTEVSPGCFHFVYT